MPSGGARPGCGRKSKAEQYARPIARAEKKIFDKLPWLVDQAMALATGVPVMQSAEEIELLTSSIKQHISDPAQLKSVLELLNKFYSTQPDFKAIQYLIDRALGKPTVKQEIEQQMTISSDSAIDRLRSILQKMAERNATQTPIDNSDPSTEE